jgi:hypothetical protein
MLNFQLGTGTVFLEARKIIAFALWKKCNRQPISMTVIVGSDSLLILIPPLPLKCWSCYNYLLSHYYRFDIYDLFLFVLFDL